MLLGTVAFSQCTETPTNRMLLVGDSWAAFMNADQTLNTAMAKFGHSDKKFTTNFVIAENGAETDDFLTSEKQDAIQTLIDANPDIDMIHLSIGGNDVLGDWNISFTQEQTDSLEAEVKDRLEQVIDFLKSTRPGIRVFWAGYTYPNFGEIIEDIAPAQSAHPFYGTWDDMGQPDFLTINSILNELSDSVAVYAANDPLVDFVPAQGILQHTFGQETPLGVAPGGTYMQFEAPLPLGYPDYPSPKQSMRPYGFFTDCFHLSTQGYLDMLSYQTQKFYQKYFMDDLYLLSEGGAKDGSVSAAGDVTSTIKMGEENGNEVAAVLSFSTSQMADTTLESASIFLRRESVSGTNPITGSQLQVKMVSGNFGTTADVEAEDFEATADVVDVPCRHGSNSDDGHWIRLDLTLEMLQNLSNANDVQFMVSVPGFSGGTVTFSDASDPELAPVLNLNYGETPEPDGIRDLLAESSLNVYPNPTEGLLVIGRDLGRIRSVEVLDLLGKVVLLPELNDNRIDLAPLKSGLYLLRVSSEKGTVVKRVVKN